MYQAEYSTPEYWKEPTPLEVLNVPAFPVETLPGVIRDYVLTVSESLQISNDFGAVAALGTLATALQGKFIVVGKKDWAEPINLYTLIVANPSEMKSTALKLFTYPITAYESRENKTRRSEISRSINIQAKLKNDLERLLASKKSTAREIEDKQNEIDSHEVVSEIRLIADDITVEALASLMKDNRGRMSLISSEGGIFESLKGRYNSTVQIDLLLKAFNGLNDEFRIDRKGRPAEYIENPTLSILLATQPQVLTELMDDSAFRGRGFHSRFLFSWPKSSVGFRKIKTEPIPEKYKTRYEKLIDDCLKFNPEKTIPLILSPEADELMNQFRAWREPRLIESLEAIEDWAGKLHGAILRISGLLHIAHTYENENCFDNNIAVSEKTMRSAIIIGRYFLEHAKKCFSVSGDSDMEKAKYVLDKILKNGFYSVVPVRTLQRKCCALKSKDELLKRLEVLKEYDYLRITHEKTVELNPLFFKKPG